MKETAQKTGKTVIYVSHNMNTIRQLCNRCIVLEDGKVIFDGDTEEAINIYTDQYSNSPALVNISELSRWNTKSSKILMESIKLLDNEEWRFPSNSKIKFELKINANNDINGVCFCFYLTSLEGQIISIFQDTNSTNYKKGESKTITFEADLTSLRPGQYCLAPELYSFSEYGTRFSHHKLGMVITFEIKKDYENNNIIDLDTNKFGYVKLPELKRLKTIP